MLFSSSNGHENHCPHQTRKGKAKHKSGVAGFFGKSADRIAATVKLFWNYSS